MQATQITHARCSCDVIIWDVSMHNSRVNRQRRKKAVLRIKMSLEYVVCCKMSRLNLSIIMSPPSILKETTTGFFLGHAGTLLEGGLC